MDFNPGDPDLIEAVEAHIARTVAPVDSVFHEILSDDFHIDVHLVGPGLDRAFHTLVTSGMSERPMETGPEASTFRFAELAICLEPSWRLDAQSLRNESWYWPIRLLKTLARFPFEANTWLGMGHSMAASDPPQPLAPSTGLVGAVLMPPMELSPDFLTMTRPDGAITHFWTVLPLYPEELALKLSDGTDVFVDALDRAGVTGVVQQMRRRGEKRRRWLGLF
jgi:hypothetical protein